jgi:hypothetical protein
MSLSKNADREELIDYVKHESLWYKMRDKFGKEVEGVLMSDDEGKCSLTFKFCPFSTTPLATLRAIVNKASRTFGCWYSDKPHVVAPDGTLIHATYADGNLEFYPEKEG